MFTISNSNPFFSFLHGNQIQIHGSVTLRGIFGLLFFFTNVQIEEQYIYAVMENSEKNNGWLQFCKEEI
jgi:hypothetical protein